MKLNTAKCETYVLIIFRVLLDSVKSIVIANQLLNNNLSYVKLLKKGTFEVIKQHFTDFISI